MKKIDTVQNILVARLKGGDYGCVGIPSETQLALEFGVSRMTARKALLALEQTKMLERASNGRLTPAGRFDAAVLPRIVVLCPAWPNYPSGMMYQGLSKAAAEVGAQLRTVKFEQWNDPVITETLAGAMRTGKAAQPGIYSGVVLFPSSEPMPEFLMNRLCEKRLRVLIVDEDYSSRGIVSLLPTPGSAATQVVKYLADISEGPIDCFNTQPVADPERTIFHAWREELRRLGRGGELINDPVHPYENAMPKAAELARKYFTGPGGLLPRAILCTTDFVALSLLNVVNELGLPIGRELKVAAVHSSGGFNEYFSPSLTALADTDCADHFSRCFRWMVSGDAWKGGRLLQEKNLRLFVGGSTEHRKHRAREKTFQTVL